MAKKLSKISRELRIGISVIVDFLNNNGYECEENPNQKIPEEAIEFLKNNISSYIKENEKNINVKKQGNEIPTNFTLETPVEINLIDCVSQYKMLVENIIGFTDLTWDYSIVKFHGKCSQPVRFTVFDEVISKLLLMDSMSLDDIAKTLGFNINDEAEKSILESAISDLKNDKMVEGDESFLCLTEIGKKYAKNGVKFSTFERDFELYIDSTTGYNGNSKKIFENLESKKQNSFSRENLPCNIEDVKPIAEIQAPEIHFPEKNYILQSCEPCGIEGYKAKLWVALLENFRDNTIRAVVYDEYKNCIIEELSKALDDNEDLKQTILDKLIEKDKDYSDGIIYTDEEKSNDQIKNEENLISIQNEYDNAFNSNDIQKAADIAKTTIKSKRHFNTVEFEAELKRLFEETRCDMWIISPWIKKNATFYRLPFFEQYLQKGGRIFIAYSKPENGYDEMADKEALEKLLELEKKYNNFYINQLEPFHFKYVWVRGANEGDWFYSGSFNILSFFVKKGFTKIRQEMMSKIDWGSEEEEYFNNVKSLFGFRYLNRAKEYIGHFSQKDDVIVNRQTLQDIKTINLGKLRPFVSNISNEYDSEFTKIQEQKNNLYSEYKLLFLHKELEKLSLIVNDLSENQNLSYEKKKEVQSLLNTLKNEYPDNLDEMIDIQEKINLLKVKDLSKIFKPRGYNPSKQKVKYKRRK